MNQNWSDHSVILQEQLGILIDLVQYNMILHNGKQWMGRTYIIGQVSQKKAPVGLRGASIYVEMFGNAKRWPYYDDIAPHVMTDIYILLNRIT